MKHSHYLLPLWIYGLFKGIDCYSYTSSTYERHFIILYILEAMPPKMIIYNN